MKKKNKSYRQYRQSMFNKYSIDESYLQTGKQRRACLELLEKIDTNQEIDDKSMIDKIAAAFQGTTLHKKVASCITVAALLAALQSAPAMAQASYDYQPRAEVRYSTAIPDSKGVQLDSDSYLDLAGSNVINEVKSSSLHLFSNKTLTNDYNPLQSNGILIDDDSDVAMFPVQQTKTLTVIDTDLADWEVLRDAVKEGEILLLDDKTDPLEAILAKLQEMGTIDCLNIISHGESGKLSFENSVIDSKALETNKDKWAKLSSYISSDGDIQLYGCNIAKGDTGKAFIEKLAQLTGADIAASINLTGSESKGGDWTLEAVVGDVARNLPFAKDAIEKFMGILLPTGDTFFGLYNFNDNGATLSNSYFQVSATVNGNTTGLDTYFGYGAYTRDISSGTIAIKVAANGTSLGTFRLSGIKIFAEAGVSDLSNVHIVGHSLDGSTVTATDYSSVHNSDTAETGNFTNFNNLSTKDLDYFILYADATKVKALQLFCFNASNMTAPVLAPTAPSKPDLIADSDTGALSTDNITSNTTPTFTGTAVAGSTVTLYDTDGTTVLGSATATGGTWSITSSTLSEGTHSITVKATVGPATSAASSPLSVKIDTTAPLAPSAPDLTAGTDTGTLSTDNITNDTTPTFAGTAEAGGTVTLFDGASQIGSTTADGSGNWSITSSALAEGSHSITAKVTDIAGNTGPASSGLSVTIDTTVPSAPASLELASASDSGTVGDYTTNDTTPTITGTAEANSKVILFEGVTQLGWTMSDASGNWSITSSTLGHGAHNITAKAADTAGNTSGASSILAITIDTIAPTITFSNLALSADTGSSSTDFITSTAVQTISATLSGALGATDKVYGSLDNGTTWTDITGKVSGTTLTWNGVTLSGSNTLKLKVSDAAGNDGTIASQAYVLATASPTTTIATIAFSADTGSSDTDFITRTAAQTISGTLSSNLASGEIVEVSLDNGTTWATATASIGQNTWSLSGQTLTSSNTMKVRVTNLAGLSGVVRSQAYVLDTTAPTITLSGLALSADTGSSDTDFVTGTAAQTISATLSSALGVTEKVYGSLDNGTTWTDITDKVSGTTLTWDGVTLSGSNTLKLKVTDTAGNDGAIVSQAYVLDTIAPTITFSNLALSADTGSSDTDFVTGTAAQTINATLSGALGATDKVYGSLDNGTTWTDITGKVSGTTLTWDGVTLSGSDTLKLKVADAAGNDGTIASQAYVLATTSPTTTIATIAFSADTGSSDNDFITRTAAQTISGTLSSNLASGEIVEVSLDNGTTWTTATASVGQNTWSLSGQTLTSSNTMKVRVTSLAGLSGVVRSQAYVLDTTAPTITFSNLAFSADTGSSDTDFVTGMAAQTISATLSSALGATEKVYGSLDNGTTWTDITDKVSGTTLTWDGAILSGSNTIKLKVTDIAGNDGTIASQDYVLDTIAPTITFSNLSLSADTGSSSTDFITSIGLQTISATLSGALGATDKAYGSLDNGTTWTDITDKVSGTTLTWDGVTLSGSNTLKLKVTDIAGNDGTIASQDYVLDIIAPTITFSNLALSADTGSSDTDFVTGTAAQTISATLSSALGVTEKVYGSLDNGTTWTDITDKVSGTTLTWDGVTLSGSNTLKLKVTDSAGNDGTIASQAYVLDTIAPTITFSNPALSADTGSSSTDFITSTEAQTISATLSGAPSATDKVYGSLDNGTTWTDITDKVSGTTLTWDGAILSGSNTLKLKVVDAAGNDGTIASQAYVLATTSPTTTIATIAFSADTGSSDTDFITRTAAQTIIGTLSSNLASGEIVEVSLDNGTTWTTATASVGQNTWSLSGQTLTSSNTMKVRVTSLAGLSGVVRSQAYVLDTTSPTGTIVVSDTALSAGETSPVTITFSEAVTGFTNADLTVANGTLSAVSSTDGGITWIATLTPTTDIADATNVITLDQSGVVDTAGNAGAGTVDSNNYAVDTRAPSAAIVISDTALAAGETSLVTITFSEAVTGFTIADLTVANGTLSGLSSADGGITWTATFTPTSNIEDTTNVITLDQTGVANGAGNPGVGTASSNNYAIDTKRPTATIAVSDTTLSAGETSLVTITFSEAVTGLTTSDFTVANGTLGAVNSTDGGITWTATLTPTADIEDTTNMITLDQAGVADASGNAGSGTVDSNNYVIDTKSPTATIVVSDTALSAGETSPVTITFSEAVTGFTNADLTVANGTLSAVSSPDGGITFTATLTPTTDIADATNVITLDQSGVVDTAGNAGAGTADSNNYAVDTRAPSAAIVISDTALAAGETSLVTITFSEAVTGFTIADLTVANGTLSGLSSADGGITWTATFTPTSNIEDTTNVITLDQTGVANGAGNPGVGTASSNNYAIDTKRPTATIAVSDTALSAGETSLVTITFSEAVTGLTTSDFTVANGMLSGLSSADGGITWTATLTPTADIEDTTNMITLDQAGVADASGNAGSGTVDSNNYAIDTKCPTVVSVAVPSNGNYSVGAILEFNVTFDDTVSVNTTNGTPSISLTIGASTVNANYISGSGSKVLKFTYTVTDGQMDTDGLTISALTLNNGIIQDTTGNTAALTLYNVDSTANIFVDTTSPTLSVGTITASELTTNSAKLTWEKATDTVTAQADLKYKVVYSTSNITTVTAAENATQAQNWTSNITTYTVTGLNPSTNYYFNVLVKDEAGNKSLYTAIAGRTTASSSSSGSSGSSSTPLASTVVNSDNTSVPTVVEVNGQKQDAGTSNTQTQGEQKVTTIKVDDTKLNKILESKGDNATVTLPSSGTSDIVFGELNGQTVKNMEQKSAILEIKTPTVTYTLPASQINIDDVSTQIGSQIELKDIKVSVKIAEPSTDTVKIVENTANKNSYQIVVKPVEFEITCSSGVKTVEVSKFNGFVERTVAIPDGIDPRKITTGIVLNSDGTFSHVPTQITQINGKYYAKINSLTNSTYSVIWNPVEFNDVVNYWAQKAINDMGSRMVVSGVGNGNYDPTRSITRAEFAAIVVRAMGLTKGSKESSFGDVSINDWFNGYVDTATAYSLIEGYDSESFGPDDTITREQAMTILARAMKLTGLSVKLNDSEISALLGNYTDGASVSQYARTSIAMCIKTGVVTGSSATTLSPKSNVTRAEVAVMVQRLLQKSGLI